MPKTLQVRDVPDDIHRTLRERAARSGTSLSEYVLQELIRIAARPPIADVLARADLRHGGTSREAIIEAVRAEREQRSLRAGREQA